MFVCVHFSGSKQEVALSLNYDTPAKRKLVQLVHDQLTNLGLQLHVISDDSKEASVTWTAMIDCPATILEREAEQMGMKKQIKDDEDADAKKDTEDESENKSCLDRLDELDPMPKLCEFTVDGRHLFKDINKTPSGDFFTPSQRIQLIISFLESASMGPYLAETVSSESFPAKSTDHLWHLCKRMDLLNDSGFILPQDEKQQKYTLKALLSLWNTTSDPVQQVCSYYGIYIYIFIT